MAAWEFAVTASDADGETPAVLTVERGTGHWSDVLDETTWRITGRVYAYDATVRVGERVVWQTCVTVNELRRLRRMAAKQAETQPVTPSAKSAR